MRKLTALFLLLLVSSSAAYAQQGLPPLRKIAVSKAEVKKLAGTRAVIETKYGNITLRFFPDLAPGHVKNFVGLARKGFYNGTIFHRVIPGFMIQGGDPVTKDPAKRGQYGIGGPGYRIPAEFNSKPHKRGVLSMARTNDPNGAGSQFFICFDMDPRQQAMLDGQYTVFGEVVSGMEVADKIASLPRDARDDPYERVEMRVKILKGKSQ